MTEVDINQNKGNFHFPTNQIFLIVIGIFALAIAMYMITIPIYEIAHELNTLNRNIIHLDKSVQGIVQEEDISELNKEFGRLNKRMNSSTLLKI